MIGNKDQQGIPLMLHMAAAVTGGSAGGHLAAMLALTNDDPALQPGFEDVDTSIHQYMHGSIVVK